MYALFEESGKFLAGRVDVGRGLAERTFEVRVALVRAVAYQRAKGALDKALVAFASDAATTQSLQAAASELGVK